MALITINHLETWVINYDGKEYTIKIDEERNEVHVGVNGANPTIYPMEQGLAGLEKLKEAGEIISHKEAWTEEK